MGRDRTLARAVLIALVAVAALALALLPSDSGQLTGIVIAVDGDLTLVRSFEVLSDGDRFGDALEHARRLVAHVGYVDPPGVARRPGLQFLQAAEDRRALDEVGLERLRQGFAEAARRVQRGCLSLVSARVDAGPRGVEVALPFVGGRLQDFL